MRGSLLALAFGCAVALLLLYGGEAVLRLTHTDPGREAVEAAREAGTPFDARTRMQVVEALRAEGRNAVPRIVPAGLLAEDGEALRPLLRPGGRELLPLAGISGRTTVLCNELGSWAVYESDERGFRNPRGLWGRAPVELVLLGDSFTIGECVAEGETIADRLRERRPATVNLGYSGSSPLLELAALAEYGPALRPRTVLWMYFENDLSWFDLGRGRRAPMLMRYLEDGARQGLLERQPEIDAALEGLLGTAVGQPDEHGPATRLAALTPSPEDQVRDALALRAVRARLASLRGAARAMREPPDYVLFARILGRARDLTAGWGGRLVVVYLPGVWNFDPGSRGPAFADPEARRHLRSIASARGIGFVDVQRAMEAHPDPLGLYSFRGDSVLGSPHMNPEGYALAADTVEAWLAER